MTVLVTGGCGYIGAHVVHALHEAGQDVVVVDDLSYGKPDRIGNARLYGMDISAPGAGERLAEIMKAENVDSVIHFAARKQVGESVEKPLWYYQQNINGMLNVLEGMREAGVKKLVFSSSAATYGVPPVDVVPEDVQPMVPINPYGQTKLFGEWMARACEEPYGIRFCGLRYFNVFGRRQDPNGAYAAVIPKWLIQEGMREHRDKTIVCIPFLFVKEYREWLSRKLDIALPQWEQGWSYDDYERRLLQTLIDRFGRQLYFSATTPPSVTEPWKEHLYNEGLTLRYSPKSYDNMTVKRRNVEENYMLEYLLVSFRPEWTSGERLSANYAVLLADLLPYYAKHDERRYKWLMNILVRAVTNTSLSGDDKQMFLNLLTDNR